MDLNGIPWPAVTAGSGGWLIAFFFCISLIRGKIVPRSAMDDVIHDRDEWRTESRIKDSQIAEKDVQLGHLKEVGWTVQQLAHGLQQEIPE